MNNPSFPKCRMEDSSHGPSPTGNLVRRRYYNVLADREIPPTTAESPLQHAACLSRFP